MGLRFDREPDFMAIYKDLTFLVKMDDKGFDYIYKAGEATRRAGIYRCEGCGKEITQHIGDPLPTENHHAHTKTQDNIRWRLIVWG